MASLVISMQAVEGPPYQSDVLPKGDEYYDLRDGLRNSWLKFEREKTGRIAFLGGSITQSSGWRDQVIAYFQEKFPQTKFDFISAGIGSLGSVPHSFRLERDVLSRGPVDLLFLEAAVNDASNIPEHPEQMLRGMEGVVRHMRLMNPFTDIVHMHFVMPEHMVDYNNGKIPVAIAHHEKVATAYGNPTLNLALEVTDRINAGEFTWSNDFKDLHPAPFGHQLYANSIKRMLSAAFSRHSIGTTKNIHLLPEPVDPRNYFQGRLGNISAARVLKDFHIDQAWKPTDSKKTRPGFVDVPTLIGEKIGAEFEVGFDGTVFGLFLTSGPDAGRIEFSIDGSSYRSVSTYTRWSAELHLPWAVILDDGLKKGRHLARVRIAENRDDKAKGNALRVQHFLLNGDG